jgi:hypothetical protein
MRMLFSINDQQFIGPQATLQKWGVASEGLMESSSSSMTAPVMFGPVMSASAAMGKEDKGGGGRELRGIFY